MACAEGQAGGAPGDLDDDTRVDTAPVPGRNGAEARDVQERSAQHLELGGSVIRVSKVESGYRSRQ
jgi:hypothetical protein